MTHSTMICVYLIAFIALYEVCIVSLEIVRCCSDTLNNDPCLSDSIIALYEVCIVSLEIVRCFNDTLNNDPSISEAIAAIQTLLEVIERSNGELHLVLIVYIQVFECRFIFMRDL